MPLPQKLLVQHVQNPAIWVNISQPGGFRYVFVQGAMLLTLDTVKEAGVGRSIGTSRWGNVQNENWHDMFHDFSQGEAAQVSS